MTGLPRLGPCSRQTPALLCVLAFRFKVFADYEAYIKCQGQVDQLFMVRAAHSLSRGRGSLAMEKGKLGCSGAPSLSRAGVG